MTSEVAIANGSAVALAADSAVTIGGRKIYNSAIKLFSLSKVEPVGIMIYGNANLLEVPWETIIKTCREHIGSKKFSTLEEYSDYFIKFIKSSNYFSEASQENLVKSNSRGYFEMMRNELYDKTRPILEQNGTINLTTTQDFFEKIISQHHEELKKLEIIADADDDFERLTKKKYKGLFKNISDEVFQNLKIKRPFVEKLHDIATFLFTRSIYANSTSGIVISGFGEDEIYPSILTYEIEGYLDGRLKFKKLDNKCYKVKSSNDCSIIAFAQEDMVAAFMDGMNPSVRILIEQYLHHIFERLPEILTDDDLDGCNLPKNDIRIKLKNSATQLLSDFLQATYRHMKENHINPVLNMVTALPKDELAAMAESLVNLTAFKRKMTESLETVGGPIDVVVISKGDGLVKWLH